MRWTARGFSDERDDERRGGNRVERFKSGRGPRLPCILVRFSLATAAFLAAAKEKSSAVDGGRIAYEDYVATLAALN